ncbi:hypothetical protein ACSBR1_015192 [Camellia fascicularis]
MTVAAVNTMMAMKEITWILKKKKSVSSATASCSADKPSTTTDKFAEDLLKEVEQLLGPEERDILQQNATPNLGKISTVSGQTKWNPFHSLGLAGQIHYMDMLLGNGLRINLADKDGMTALHTAIIGTKEAVVSHLLRKGANPNIGDRDGASPLHYAVQVGGMQTVKLLIKYNFDVNASDNEGWTPLHIATQTRNRDIAKVLLVNGADKTRRNKDGKTPLDLALCYGKDFKSYDLAKLLKLRIWTDPGLANIRTLKNSSRVFLSVLVFALVIEIVAHFKKWNLNLINPWEVQGLVQWSYMAWLSFRVDCIAPSVVFLSKFCVVLFMIQLPDRLVLCFGCFWMKCKKLKPVIEGEPYDIEDCSSFPMVLVQIPMCNERELDWPKNRFLVHVLDDSDVESLENLIRNEVFSWKQKGVNIIYRHRFIRTGYNAGNLKSATGCDYVKDYEFVAIFDADFQPNPDFLKLTIPHFKGNPMVGLVQARWSFVNKDENLLTRLQNVNLCFHFEVEQQVNGMFINFFGFNGTAGVWRIKALEESGVCKKQQRCWHSGLMQLFGLCLPAILTSKISMWKKANMIFLFFLLRKLILPFYSFTLFCVILPLAMFIPEAELPLWLVCYVPVFLSFLNVLPSPKSFPFLIPYLLFENTMSLTKFNAMVSGLFQLGSAYSVINSGVMKNHEKPFFA